VPTLTSGDAGGIVGPRQIKGAIISSELVEADDWAGYFELLGHETERRWAAVDGDTGGFAEIAAAVLADVPMPVGFDSATLLADVVARRDLPTQEDPRAGFGEPPLTLFRGNEFFVSALYWLDGTTTIHQHSFSGAFRVLSGSSLHMPYDFDVREALSDRLKLGALDMHAPEILRCGDIRAIHYGDEFIHSLFHLERPSVTAVIRTYGDGSPQPVYLRPGLSLDPFLRDNSMARRFQSLLSLQAIDPGAARRAAQAFIEDEDLWAGFLLLMRWTDRVDRGQSLFDLVAVMQRRHGEVMQDLGTALVEYRREFSIGMRRRTLRDPEQRLFLALLLNLPDVNSIQSVLRQIYPEREPGDVLADWVTDLSHPQNKEMSGISLSADSVAQLTGALRACDPKALHAISTSMSPPELLSPLFN
jgi:hypothetical protein